MCIRDSSEADVENPTGSVFCSHGAGYNVRWDQVAQHMHIPFVFKKIKKTANNIQDKSKFDNIDDELENIFTRTYGPVDVYKRQPNNIFN